MGFVPPFFAPAFGTPDVLENFWRHTLSAYLDNPLPALFKEKLLAYLGRFSKVPYFVAFHSCALRPLGMTGPQVLALIESPLPLTDADEARAVALLAAIPTPLREWLPHSTVEACLIACSARMFLHNGNASRDRLRRLLEPDIYSHLIALMAYARTSHFWIEAHPELSYDDASGTLATLAEEEPRLAQFLREYPKPAGRETASLRERFPSHFTDLKSAEVSFRSLLESTPDPMMVVDHNGQIRLVNTQTEKAFGYTGDELLGKPIEMLVPERFREGHMRHRAGYSADPHFRPMGAEVELYGLRKDGSEFPLDISLSPVPGDGGTFTMASMRDITERKNTERALRDSDEQIRLLMNSTAEGIYGVDLQGCCTFMNASGLQLLGYSDDKELLGKNMHGLIHHKRPDGSDYPAEQCRIRQASRSGKGIHADDEVLCRRDGTCFAAEYWSHPLRKDGQMSGCVVTFLDITARKRAEKEGKRLSDIVAATPGLVGISSWVDNSLLYLNPAGRRLLGIGVDEDLSGLRLRDFRAESDWPRIAGEVLPVALKEGVWSGETVFVTRDGREIPVLQVVIAHQGPDGSVEFLSTIAHDLTESRRMETQLRQSQKMEAIGRLTGGIAHDFNNLLTIIMGYSNLLLDELPKNTPGVEFLDQIRKAGDRAVSLTRQMLAFSRKQVLHPRVLNLNDVVFHIESMLRRLIGENIHLVTILAPNLGNTKVDSGQMDQIVLNLAVNARDAMADGGTLTIETSNVEMDASFTYRDVEIKPGPYVLLSISDTGSGMDSATVAQIFEPFFTTKGQGKGTGLGLATVYGIVKQSGGYIWVYSEPGRGTTFKIYFPAITEPADADEAAAGKETPVDGSETILLVEDEEMVRSLARTLLRRNGYKVLESEDCDDALRIARQYEGTIDLLLTDVVMPRMSGPRLAEHVRLCREGIRVLFMSGYAENAVQNRGLLDATGSFLEKPFSAESLLQMVRQTLAAPAGPAPEREAAILIVDDEEPVRNVIVSMLQQAGHKVFSAPDALAASRILEKVAVDLVITDVLLPYKDGIDFSAELRRTFPELKIIVMTGASPALKYVPTTRWFQDVLTKPVIREQLMSAVKAALHG